MNLGKITIFKKTIFYAYGGYAITVWFFSFVEDNNPGDNDPTDYSFQLEPKKIILYQPVLWPTV